LIESALVGTEYTRWLRRMRGALLRLCSGCKP
jgi:hypothetical protein